MKSLLSLILLSTTFTAAQAERFKDGSETKDLPGAFIYDPSMGASTPNQAARRVDEVVAFPTKLDPEGSFTVEAFAKSDTELTITAMLMCDCITGQDW